jgi:hypothetical protein
MISGLGYTSAIASLNSAANAPFLIATKLGLNLFTYSKIQHTHRYKTVSFKLQSKRMIILRRKSTQKPTGLDLHSTAREAHYCKGSCTSSY